MPVLLRVKKLHVVTCRVVRATRKTGSSSDDWIYQHLMVIMKVVEVLEKVIVLSFKGMPTSLVFAG
jgi:hypothetical protein